MKLRELAILTVASLVVFFWYRLAHAQNSYLPCLPTAQVKERLKNLG